MGPYSNVFGWGDRGEIQNPHVEWEYFSYNPELPL